MEHDTLERILSSATAEGPGLNSRHFVIFKSIEMAAVGCHPADMEYWPTALAVAAFRLDTGHVANWWTLVDTGKQITTLTTPSSTHSASAPTSQISAK